MSNIVSSIIAEGLILEVERKLSILYNRLIIFLGRRDPHNLHLSIFVCEPKMYLLMSRFFDDFNFSNFDELF